MLCAGRAPRRRFRIGGGEDGLGDARLPDEVGRSYIREQRPKRSIGYIHPTTPLPNAEVSFLTGGKLSIRRAWSSVADLNRHSRLGRPMC